MAKLGMKLKSVGFALRGQIEEEQLPVILRSLIKLINMTPVGEPFVVRFPHPDSDPSIVGDIIAQPITAAQPLVFQSLAESYGYFLPGIIPVDTWPEFFDGKGAVYLMVTSCRDFNEWDVEKALEDFGFEVLDKDVMLLGFDNSTEKGTD